MKVTILMSTYNGENFLAEQIESIQQQTYKKMIALLLSILIKLKI